MNNLYRLSQYKFKVTPKYPKNLKTLPTSALLENSLGELVEVYTSVHLGILIRNHTTNLTEKYESSINHSYLDAIEDHNGNICIVFINNKGANLRFYNDLNKDYSEYILKIDSDKCFLCVYNDQTFCFYLNKIDNKIYYYSSEDDFLEPTLASHHDMSNQDLDLVAEDVNTGRPFTFLTYNNLEGFKGNDRELIPTAKYLEIYTSPKLYRKEVTSDGDS